MVDQLVEAYEKRETASSAQSGRLLRIHHNDPQHLSLLIGGMSETHFQRLPETSRRIIDAIEVERELVFLLSNGVAYPLIHEMNLKMHEYSEAADSVDSDNVPKISRPDYVQFLLERKDDISALINGQPRRLHIGNNPGKLDRDWTFPCLKMCRQAQAMVCQLFSGTDAHKMRLGIAMEEATLNGTRHGNGCDPRKPFTIDACVDRGALVIQLRDAGWGFNHSVVNDPTTKDTLELSSGRGLKLMRSFTDSVDFGDDGRLCILTKRFQ